MACRQDEGQQTDHPNEWDFMAQKHGSTSLLYMQQPAQKKGHYSASNVDRMRDTAVTPSFPSNKATLF
jgi:hypothetical protein